jgi:dUTP pyrophosphatase
MKRGFEIVTSYLDKGVRLPKRKTGLSAGYDLEGAESVTIPPLEMGKIPTGLKACMMPDEALMIYPRSSLFQTKKCIFVNSVAIIDADYYNNPGNEGHIILTLYNLSVAPVTIVKGERFAQGVFQKYLKTDDDVPTDAIRMGGYGSTGL